MMRHIFRPSRGFFVSFLSALGIACFSVAAFAAPPPNVVAGCNQNVWDMLKAKADAQVAYDAAVTAELINKPDSVLTLTCFDQAASISATVGGKIFSGDFSTPLSNVMTVNNNGGGGGFTCATAGVGNAIWNNIVGQGVDTSIPYVTLDDLVNQAAAPPLPGGGAAGADFTTTWAAAHTAGVLGPGSALANAVTALPAPIPVDFSTAKSSCDVLIIAGIMAGAVGGPCP